MINTAVEDPERVARGLVRLAQSHRQLCADFLRDHRDGMDTPVVAKFAARIRMFDRVFPGPLKPTGRQQRSARHAPRDD
jgi:hypothetical protein